MSDQPQGAGWWQASDGKWYPPSQAPQAAPPPMEPPPPTPGSPYAPPAPPTGPPMGQPGMAYPAGYAVAPPQRSGMSGCAKAAIVVAVLALLLGGGCVVALAIFADDAVESIDDARQNGREDTEITSCELDDAGFMVAEVEITNRSSGRSRYVIAVEFDAPGSTTSLTGGDDVLGVEPGETRVLEIRSTDTTTEELDCAILEAFRTADE